MDHRGRSGDDGVGAVGQYHPDPPRADLQPNRAAVGRRVSARWRAVPHASPSRSPRCPHNLVGGLAIDAAFVTDIRLGIVTWLIAAAHEIPQELGDFGILAHSGWSRSRALAFNASAATVLVGAVTAYALADHIEIAVLIPFAAGNFIYIALADLIPELTTAPAGHDKPSTHSGSSPPSQLFGVAVAA